MRPGFSLICVIPEREMGGNGGGGLEGLDGTWGAMRCDAMMGWEVGGLP